MTRGLTCAWNLGAHKKASSQTYTACLLYAWSFLHQSSYFIHMVTVKGNAIIPTLKIKWLSEKSYDLCKVTWAYSWLGWDWTQGFRLLLQCSFHSLLQLLGSCLVSCYKIFPPNTPSWHSSVSMNFTSRFDFLTLSFYLTLNNSRDLNTMLKLSDWTFPKADIWGQEMTLFFCSILICLGLPRLWGFFSPLGPLIA